MAVRPGSYLSLFSGIGALDIAVGRVFGGARPVCYVEVDAAHAIRLAHNVEAGRLPAAPVWSDVRTFDGRQLRDRVDLVVGGFPCQDLSVAGRRAGINGQRSGLFFELVRIVDELRPRYLFLENVAAITAGRELDSVLGALAELGFDARWSCLRASDVGAPHRRDRWWCLAWHPDLLADGDSDERSADVPGLQGGRAHGRPDAGGSRRDMADAGLGPVLRPELTAGVRGVSPAATPDAAQRQRAWDAADDRGNVMGDAGRAGLAVGRSLSGNADAQFTAAERAGAVRIPAWPPGPSDHDGWRAVLAEYPDLAPALSPPLRRVADGRPVGLDVCLCARNDRLRGLGNAVVPQCAEAALRGLWADVFGHLR